MNDLREQAMKHVMRVEKLKEQHAELEEFQEALLNLSRTDIKISIETSTISLYQVWLEKDLGITSIQAELKNKLIAETHKRKKVLEMTLKQLIGENEND